ncbi:MAG: hypothetical protein MK085_07410 [Phycisphaerales bacterium]|nr:hypothetical protein [Phycisphaerales bacterium]
MTDVNPDSTIRRVAFLFAMEVEGRAFARHLDLVDQGRMDPDLPASWLTGRFVMEGGCPLDVAVGFAGSDEVAGCDRIGTNAATLASYLLCRQFKPDLLVNAGTCGGFHAQGAKVGDICVGSDAFLFHDRWVPLAEFEAFAVGRIPTLPVKALCQVLDARPGVVSTGDSFTTNEAEMAFFEREEVMAKEMEAAAVARLARDLKVPFVAIKGISDLVDHPEQQSSEMFRNNLLRVSEAVGERLVRLLEWLAKGHGISDMG